MAKIKNLTLADIKKADASLYGKKKVINVLENSSVTIDEVFRPTKIQEALAELLDKRVYVSRNPNIDQETADRLWPTYSLLLLIKHFTSVWIPDSYEEQIVVMNGLINVHCFDLIVNAFAEEEVIKWINAIKGIGDNAEEIARLAIEYEKMNEQKAEGEVADKTGSEEDGGENA